MERYIESILRQALSKFRKRSEIRAKGKCLTEEDIAIIIEEEISESEREQLFEHILSCQKCTIALKEHLLVLNAIDKKSMLDTPEAVIQAAMDLVRPEVGPNILEVVLNFKERLIELVRTTGEVLRGPQLIPVPVLRSQGEDKAFPNEIKVVKEFDNIITEVGVERKKPEFCEVEIRLTEKDTKRKMQGFRATLIKRGKELESSLIDAGKVIFREVRPAKYVISITKDNQKLGIVELLITTSK